MESRRHSVSLIPVEISILLIMEGSASTVEGKSSNGESSHVKSNLQDIGGKLAMAIKYKEEGTMHFKAANYKKAIVSYAKVTAFTRYVFSLSFSSTNSHLLTFHFIIL